MTIEERYFNIDKEDTETVKDCAYLGSGINLGGHCNQEIKRRLRLEKAAMEK